MMDEVECHVKMMMALYQTGWMHGANSTTKLKLAQVSCCSISILMLTILLLLEWLWKSIGSFTTILFLLFILFEKLLYSLLLVRLPVI